ncbi:hypothetical protein ACFL6E_04475 [Candidatus Neomarinimicrobiota bacterium]
MRSLVIIVLGGLLAWLILHLIETVKQIMPGDQNSVDKSYKSDSEIIDADFEEVEDKKK